MKLSIEGRDFQVELGQGVVKVDGQPLKVEVKESGGNLAAVNVEGKPYRVEVKERGARGALVAVDGKTYRVAVQAPLAPGKPRAARATPSLAATLLKEEEETGVCKTPLLDAVRAVMPGRILSVKVREGERVKAGAVLCILEAMKMENEIRAPKDGVVTAVQISEGVTVNGGDVLMQVC